MIDEKTDVEKFIGLLKSRTKSWSELDYPAQIGLRIIKFSGDLVREALLGNLIEDWVEQLFAQLPGDACLMDAIPPVFLDCSSSHAGYYDEYCIIVASKEWPALNNGELIPEFFPQFKLPYTRWKSETEQSSLPQNKVGSLADLSSGWTDQEAEEERQHVAELRASATDLRAEAQSEIAARWTCTNHNEPIIYTDGTVECYCGSRKDG